MQNVGTDPDKCPNLVNLNLHYSGGIGLTTQWGGGKNPLSPGYKRQG